jgi:hypothetical protein
MTLRRWRGDGQRLAGALALLRRGLHDGADPLYDPWKLGRGRARADARLRSPPRADAPRRRLVFPRWSAIVFTSALLFAASAALLTWLSHSRR